MPLLRLEHSPAAYCADFVLYAAASVAMALTLVFTSPTGMGTRLTAWALAGGVAWTPVEYLLHRFVLHGVAPFDRWHAEHHRRPTALIGSPTLISASLFAILAFMPAWAAAGLWPATALTFGLVSGYLAYGLTHHATHHAVPGLGRNNAWLALRSRWHALQHVARVGTAPLGHYGVRSGLWDQVFGTEHIRKT